MRGERTLAIFCVSNLFRNAVKNVKYISLEAFCVAYVCTFLHFIVFYRHFTGISPAFCFILPYFTVFYRILPQSYHDIIISSYHQIIISSCHHISISSYHHIIISSYDHIIATNNIRTLHRHFSKNLDKRPRETSIYRRFSL